MRFSIILFYFGLFIFRTVILNKIQCHLGRVCPGCDLKGRLNIQTICSRIHTDIICQHFPLCPCCICGIMEPDILPCIRIEIQTQRLISIGHGKAVITRIFIIAFGPCFRVGRIITRRYCILNGLSIRRRNKSQFLFAVSDLRDRFRFFLFKCLTACEGFFLDDIADQFFRKERVHTGCGQNSSQQQTDSFLHNHFPPSAVLLFHASHDFMVSKITPHVHRNSLFVTAYDVSSSS